MFFLFSQDQNFTKIRNITMKTNINTTKTISKSIILALVHTWELVAVYIQYVFREDIPHLFMDV